MKSNFHRSILKVKIQNGVSAFVAGGSFPSQHQRAEIFRGFHWSTIIEKT